MDSESSAKTSKKDESTEDIVPSVDPNDPLVLDTQEDQSNKEVPESNPDADLNIEKLTKETNIPESNLNASLKVEEEPQKHGEYENKSNKNLFVAGAVGAGIILLSIAGFMVLGFRSSQEKKEADIPIEQPKISQKEEEPVIDRSEWSIEVLNGSGVSGAAKDLAEKLEELGYKIVKTGNAGGSNYKNTELYISKDYVDKSDLLLEDLEDTINVSTVSGELKDSTASAKIIIGKD